MTKSLILKLIGLLRRDYLNLEALIAIIHKKIKKRYLKIEVELGNIVYHPDFRRLQAKFVHQLKSLWIQADLESFSVSSLRLRLVELCRIDCLYSAITRVHCIDHHLNLRRRENEKYKPREITKKKKKTEK
ncbi:hypothetical protein L2E82_06945 [Cichorium intybus]|uniref:Uncharacterized protein n=1 Tax=Cichorium intybus TaxID=13427 RepID=A0ACB9G3I9_CICIN|nr:hypothetical protein L2E82_06945 [Cichorium intybus]